MALHFLDEQNILISILKIKRKKCENSTNSCYLARAFHIFNSFGEDVCPRDQIIKKKFN